MVFTLSTEKYVCDRCDSEFENVLEKVEFALPGLDMIVIKNDLKNPSCEDCMLEAFTSTLNSL